LGNWEIAFVLMNISEVASYSFDELKEILQLSDIDDVTVADVKDAVQSYFDNYEVNDEIVRFLKEVEFRMVSEIENSQHDEQYDEQNAVEMDANFNQRDESNPTIGNSISRLVILDSRYANNAKTSSVSQFHKQTNIDKKTNNKRRYKVQSVDVETTDYVCRLTEELTNVLSFSLYSFSIPHTYYNIDESYSNNTFKIRLATLTTITITLPDGYYSLSNFLKIFQETVEKGGIISTSGKPVIATDDITGKIILNFDECMIQDFVIDSNCTIVFFETSKDQCKEEAASNSSLGWLMGFVNDEYYIESDGNYAESIINLNVSKYFVINIDDFTQDQIKTSLVGIEMQQKNNVTKLPKFYMNHAKNLSCNPEKGNHSMLTNIKDGYPRSLTLNQLYALNQITQSTTSKINYLMPNFIVSNSFAVIPIKKPYNDKYGEMSVEIGGTLQDNKRVYKGPTTITKLRVTLLDDRGYVVNLNGGEWSIILKFQILVEQNKAQKMKDK